MATNTKISNLERDRNKVSLIIAKKKDKIEEIEMDLGLVKSAILSMDIIN